MPAHADVLEPHQAWTLVAFLETLVAPEQRAPSGAVLGEERAGWMILRMHRDGPGMRIVTQRH